jgi:MFS family permease
MMPAQDTDYQAPEAKDSLLSPLRNRSYRYIYVGQAVSGLGNGMYTITLAWAVYKTIGSASDMGIVLVANVIPQIAFAVFGGVLADRIPRRKVILVSNFGAGLATLALCVGSGFHVLDLSFLVGCSFLLGVFTAFFGPAFSSIFKEILAPDELRAGNALRGVTANVTRLVSPAVGGAVYLWGGPLAGFGLDAASFVFAGVTVTMIATPGLVLSVTKRSLLGEVGDGFRYLLSQSSILAIILVSLILNTLCIAPIEVLLALMVRQSHEGSWLLGVALSVQAGVAAAGSAAVGKFGARLKPGTAFIGLACVMASGIVIVGLNAGIWTILAGVTLIGAGFTFSVIEDTVLQRCVPNEYLGRVYSVGTLAAYSLLPLGYIFAGFGATRFGAGRVLLIGGALAIIACVTASFIMVRDPASPLNQKMM